MLPSQLAAVHKKFKTPWINTIIVGIAACIAAGFCSLDVLSEVTNVGSLAAFTIVCLTVIYLRFSAPGLERPFRTPMFPVTPILGALMCLVLFLSLWSHKATRDFFIIYLTIGVVFYFVFGIWNSKLRKGEIVSGHEAAPMELPHVD